MREIKFRYILKVCNTCSLDPAYTEWLELPIFTLAELENGRFNRWIIKEGIRVIETIAKNQYIGLDDKGKKEIYEDDITNNGIIVWVDDENLSEFVGWHLKDLHKDKYGKYRIHSFYAYTTPFKILGNIHENPELWEEKK